MPVLVTSVPHYEREYPQFFTDRIQEWRVVVILYLFFIPFFSLPAAEKINVYRNNGAGYENLMSICLIAIILSGIAYVIAPLVLLRRYRKSIQNGSLPKHALIYPFATHSNGHLLLRMNDEATAKIKKPGFFKQGFSQII